MRTSQFDFARRVVRWAIAACVALFITVGCDGPTADSDVASSSTPTANDGASAPPDEDSDIRLQTIDRAGFDRVLQHHRGKVVFVDYWATWCGNCMEEFPHTVALHEKYAADGLAVISVAMEFDPADEATRRRALDFLKSQHARFDNLFCDSPEAMSQHGIDVLPHYRLFDRSGRLHREFTFSDPDQPISQADIEAAVRELLAAPPDAVE